MGLQYDYYQNPPQKGSDEQPKLHARMKPTGTMQTSDVVELIQQFTSLSTADAKGALDAYINVMKMGLRNGKMVQIDGLGLFSLTLDCPPLEKADERRAESIRIRSVAFRPAAELVDSFKGLHPERVREKSHSRKRSPQEIDRLLASHFKDNPCITRKEFCQLCGVTFSTSMRRINSLIADGRLRKAAYGVGVYAPGKEGETVPKP